ncbi:hypothetical protein TSACC_3251 [Terrimicrobium sacchariphilum]|uniref:Uncharacterized protein n=2 Tax=Terrimicrobium sacchariphilum TaxID=690879 RepID=A0A146GEX6_TERSA|nr:hypothetical protein TSACC_3251 [Terrimicrobium sacchariphilum]
MLMKSLFLAFVVLSSALAGASELYSDSQTDFSQEQGANGWRYLYWDGVNKTQELEWQQETRKWALGDGGIWIGGMHPISTKAYIVREWTCPESGSVQIEGKGELFLDAAGVTLIIVRNYDMDHPLWTKELDANQSEQFSIQATVAKGDTLDFMIVGKDGVGIRNDSTAWLFAISPAK